jgi:hypothetical protein
MRADVDQPEQGPKDEGQNARNTGTGRGNDRAPWSVRPARVRSESVTARSVERGAMQHQGTRMDSDTVTWDQAEPADLLFWVQRALHRYIENPGCEECLGLAREGLGRLRPGLEVAGQHDAIPLCEELVRVTAALDEGRLQWSHDASVLIEQAARRLSGIAEPGESGSQSGLLLPLVNELRALRGVGALMMPAIVIASGVPSAPATAPRVGKGGQPPDTGHSRATQPQTGEDSGVPLVSRDEPPREVSVQKAKAPSPPVVETAHRSENASATPGGGPRATGVPHVPGLPYDRELLEHAVLAPHLDRAPARLPEVLATAVRALGRAFAQWRGDGAGPEGARALGDRLRILRTMARPVALRFGEFAGILEFLLNALAERGQPVRHEALQLIADAVEVMPLLLDEVRAGGPADTPLADIVLRAEAVLAGEPGGVAEEDPLPPSQDLPGLERIRSRGQAEMARLAAVFEALDGGAGSADRKPAGSRKSGPGEGPTDLRAAREQVAQLVDWQHRVVDALTRIAAQTQALEAVVGVLHSSAAETLQSGTRTEAGIRASEALEELRHLHKGLGVAVGDASAAVLRQQRLTRVLQDALQARGPDDISGHQG